MFFNSFSVPILASLLPSSQSPSPLFLLFERMMISSIATLPQNLIKIPAELVKQRAQIQPDIPIPSLISQIYNKEGGISGFYRGSASMLGRELPYNALQMAFYEWLRDSLRNVPLASIISDPQIVAAGMGLIAASLAAILTQVFSCIIY